MSDIRVTYYLGAGASANAIPMVSNIHDYYSLFLEYIKNNISQFDWRGNNHFNPEIIDIAFNKFGDITEKLRSHHTPDTFAKKLWLTRKVDELRQLKIYLALFFYWIENRYVSSSNKVPKGGVDERYDPFLATLLERNDNGSLQFPNSINIITWNYDSQIEIAYSMFDNQLYDPQIRSNLGIIPKAYQQESLSHQSKVIKLNGCSRLRYRSKEIQNVFNHPTSDQILKDLVNEFIAALGPSEENYDGPLINFAWETDNPASQESLKEAKDIFSKTQILVIIGYSFPTFNRQVDKELFKHLPPDCRVYYQAPEKVVLDLIDKLKSIKHFLKLVKPVINLDQFHIPIEL